MVGDLERFARLGDSAVMAYPGWWEFGRQIQRLDTISEAVHRVLVCQAVLLMEGGTPVGPMMCVAFRVVPWRNPKPSGWYGDRGMAWWRTFRRTWP